MQIVIDIPEEYKKQFDENRCKEKFDSLATNEFGYILRKAFENGTPLPKGHGDLKDMGNLQYVFDLTREDPIYSGKDIERAIKSMTTIIESI